MNTYVCGRGNRITHMRICCWLQALRGKCKVICEFTPNVELTTWSCVHFSLAGSLACTATWSGRLTIERKIVTRTLLVNFSGYKNARAHIYKHAYIDSQKSHECVCGWWITWLSASKDPAFCQLCLIHIYSVGHGFPAIYPIMLVTSTCDQSCPQDMMTNNIQRYITVFEF